MSEQFTDVRVFASQISAIKNPAIKTLVLTVLQRVPQRFFVEPASSSGKYHSPMECGKFGLVYHTKMLVKWANELLNLEMYDELRAFRDEIYAACLLHDCIKFGFDEENKWTVYDHPNLAADFVMRIALDLGTVDKDSINRICGAIRSHSGQWNCDKYGNEIMPKPATNFERFVHLCDYCASRSWVDVSVVNLDLTT